MHGVDDIDFYTIKSSVVHYADTVSHTIQGYGNCYICQFMFRAVTTQLTQLGTADNTGHINLKGRVGIQSSV